MGLFQRVCPVDGVQSVEQSLSIGRNTQTPLAHLLLHHRISAAYAHAVHHLVVGQYGAQACTPVHHCLTEIGDTIVHQRLLLLLLVHALPVAGREYQFFRAGNIHTQCTIVLKVGNEVFYGLSLLQVVVVIRVEHLLKGPLGPVVIIWITSADLSVPVETETDLVELFPIAVNVVHRRDGRMLSGLYGILLGRQSIRIVAHGVEYIVALEAFVAGKDVGSDVTQWMAYVQAGSGWIGKHVEDIEFLFVLVFFHLVGLLVNPHLAPFLLNFSEIVFHLFF